MIWQNSPLIETNVPFSTNKLIEGPLIKVSKSNILKLKTRHFVLYEDRFLYYKVYSCIYIYNFIRTNQTLSQKLIFYSMGKELKLL